MRHTHTAYTGSRLLVPFSDLGRIRLAPPAPGCQPHPLPDAAAALAWFDTEHVCVLGAQQTAITHSWHQTVWDLAWTLDTFHCRRGHLHDQLAAWLAGLAAAQQLHDRTAYALAHHSVGYAYARLGRYDEAFLHLNQALTQVSHEDYAGEARIHRTFAWALGRQGNASGSTAARCAGSRTRPALVITCAAE